LFPAYVGKVVAPFFETKDTMKIRNQKEEGEKIELEMTSMIDIVFQLLIFFIMTFKIAASEGYFVMSLSDKPSAGPPDPNASITLTVTLPDGNGDGILDTGGFAFNGKKLDYNSDPKALSPMQSLTQQILQEIPNPETRDENDSEPIEVEIDAAPTLHYQYVMQAVDAVSGYKTDSGTVKLIEKVRLKDNAE